MLVSLQSFGFLVLCVVTLTLAQSLDVQDGAGAAGPCYNMTHHVNCDTGAHVAGALRCNESRMRARAFVFATSPHSHAATLLYHYSIHIHRVVCLFWRH